MPVTSSLHAKLTVISGEKVNANILTIRGGAVAGRAARLSSAWTPWLNLPAGSRAGRAAARP